MSTIDLTLPLYPYMPVGNVWAWDSPFQLERVMTRERHGLDQYHMSFHNEGGTRLMLASCYVDDAETVEELDYSPFLDRLTSVLDIPKGPRGQITAEDIESAFAAAAHLEDGDAVLIRTGWGDAQRYRALGDDYAIRTPHFTVEGAERLVELMQARDTTLMMTDCAYIGNAGVGFQYPEWASKPPWDRPPFPSQQARIYMRHYTPERGAGGGAPDWAASVPLHKGLTPVAALANCGAITTPRARVTVLPLMLAGAAGAPCRVFASEVHE